MLSSWRLLADPLARAVMLGPVLLVAIFAMTSPYDEVRFIFPAMLMLFGVAGLVLGVSRYAAMAREWNIMSIINGLILCLLCLLSAFERSLLPKAAVLYETGIASALAIVAFWALRARSNGRRILVDIGTAGVGVVLLLGYSWTHWHSTLDHYREMTNSTAVYGERAELWLFIRSQPPGDVAYAGFPEAYPLMGFDLSRRVMYCPTRADVKSLIDLPNLPDHLPGEVITAAVDDVLAEHPDRSVWLENIRRGGASYLVVAIGDKSPVEVAYANSDPVHFQPIFPAQGSAHRDSPGVVYRIIKP